MFTSIPRIIPLTLFSIATLIVALAIALLSSPSASADEFCQSVKGGDLCLSLNPDPDTNPTGTEHTVTATILYDGTPLKIGTGVMFYILSGPNAGESGEAAFDESGNATFTYTGDGGLGTDEIIAVACEQGLCAEIIGCLDSSVECLAKIEAVCSFLEEPSIAPDARVAAAGKGGFCFGPAYADKIWVDPTPSPSPTPVDVGAGGQTPAPTPAQLPQSGGDDGASSSTWVAMVVAAAAIAASGGALALARRRISR